MKHLFEILVEYSFLFLPPLIKAFLRGFSFPLRGGEGKADAVSTEKKFKNDLYQPQNGLCQQRAEATHSQSVEELV